ncbi:MAG: 2-C-methyl-D-erythritol 2,4-cyclodiphosphate synthase [bacterium]
MDRVGIGFDSHKYKKGEGLKLGGILIPCQYSFQAHSDGDIIIHSIIDAILGALPDVFEYQNIGSLFPDNDPKYLQIDSCLLLNEVLVKIYPWKIHNCDIVLIMQEPKLGDKVKEVINNLQKLLKTDLVNVKPKTAENMGLIGKGKGAAAFCTLTLKKINN